MQYYIEKNKKILLCESEENKYLLENSLTQPQYKGLKIQKTEREIIFLDNEFVFADEHQEEIEKKEKERIGNLQCTKRVFALMLQELGVDYLTQLKPLIDSNPQAQLEWELCIELQRKNPLIDVMAGQLGITSEQLDLLFKYANGEITAEEFKGAK